MAAGNPRYHTTTNLDSKIYLAGGNLNHLLECEVKKNLCSRLAKLPQKLDFPQSIFVRGTYYFLGGVNQERNANEKVYVFDRIKKTWNTINSLNVPRSRFSVATFEDRIWAIGGHKDDSRFPGKLHNIADIETLDLTKMVWQTESKLPTPRHGHTALFVNDKLYVIGGYADKGPTGIVEIYDTQSKTWTKSTPLKFPRGFHGATLRGEKIIVYGGRSPTPLPTEVFDIKHQKWKLQSTLPFDRARFGSGVLVDNRIVVIGGEKNSGFPIVVPTFESLGFFDWKSDFRF